jgi:hypothetical protein
MVVLELYHKGIEDLTGPLLSMIIKPLHASRRAGPLSRVLLTYKGRPSAQENPKAAAALRAVLPPEVQLSAVWSAKNAQVGSGKHARGTHATREDATFARFLQYTEQLSGAGGDSVLVVSGAGGKPQLDAVATLRRVPGCAPPLPLKLGAAFNPHIGGTLDPHCGEDHREKEWQRLQQKLSTGVVRQVWVSFGADTAALEFGLRRLREHISQLDVEEPEVLGSIFVPSKAWLAKMRFRCWNGTFLGSKDDPQGYLSQGGEVARCAVGVALCPPNSWFVTGIFYATFALVWSRNGESGG